MRRPFLLNLAGHIFANKLRSMFGRAQIPYKLIWNTTNYCNSRCLTCNIWQIFPTRGGSQKLELEASDAGRIIGSLGKNLLWLTLSGGEPTLKRKVADAVRQVYDACPRLGLITVNTNAIVPRQTLRVIKSIAEHCTRAQVHVLLSLDGVGPVHDRVRGVDGNYDSVLQTRSGLLELRKQLPNVRIGFQSTVSKHNLSNLEELVDVCNEYGDEHSITFAQEAELYQNHGDGHDVTLDRASLFPALETVLAKYRIRHPYDYLQWAHLRLMRLFILERRVPVPCTAGSSSITLSPKGEVTGCLFLDNRIANASEFGDDLVKLVHSEAAAVVRRNCASCRQCWTNCESFPSMMNSPLRTLIHAARRVPPPEPSPEPVQIDPGWMTKLTVLDNP